MKGRPVALPLFRFSVLLTFCQAALLSGGGVRAEEYPDCRLRCETAYTDCSNAAPDSEPEVQQAKMASCNSTLLDCYADCENLKPIESPSGTENNPNLIRK